MKDALDCPLVILAGGRATRLAHLSEQLPKFLMPVAEGARFADVQLEWARRHGFRDVVLSVGYRGEQIEAYCGDGSRHGLSITYAHDGDTPLGTGGAVARAVPPQAQEVAVLYGDTILELDCGEVIRRRRSLEVPALMTVLADPPPGHTCNAHLEGQRVHYSKRAPHPRWRHIDYGFLVLTTAWARSLARAPPFDLAAPLEEVSARGELGGFLATERFWEINTADALEAFRARFGRHG